MYKTAILGCFCIKELNGDNDSNLDAFALQPLLEEFTVYLQSIHIYLHIEFFLSHDLSQGWN